MSDSKPFQDILFEVIVRNFHCNYDNVPVNECHEIVNRFYKINLEAFIHRLNTIRFVFFQDNYHFLFKPQIDDICYYDYNECKKYSNFYCKKIHVIISAQNICQAPENLNNPSCSKCDSTKLHLHKSCLTDRFISNILLIYSNRSEISLYGLEIPIDTFIDLWYKTFHFHPIHKRMSEIIWLKLLSTYNEHHDQILWKINKNQTTLKFLVRLNDIKSMICNGFVQERKTCINMIYPTTTELNKTKIFHPVICDLIHVHHYCVQSSINPKQLNKKSCLKPLIIHPNETESATFQLRLPIWRTVHAKQLSDDYDVITLKDLSYEMDQIFFATRLHNNIDIYYSSIKPQINQNTTHVMILKIIDNIYHKNFSFTNCTFVIKKDYVFKQNWNDIINHVNHEIKDLNQQNNVVVDVLIEGIKRNVIMQYQIPDDYLIDQILADIFNLFRFINNKPFFGKYATIRTAKSSYKYIIFELLDVNHLIAPENIVPYFEQILYLFCNIYHGFSHLKQLVYVDINIIYTQHTKDVKESLCSVSYVIFDERIPLGKNHIYYQMINRYLSHSEPLLLDYYFKLKLNHSFNSKYNDNFEHFSHHSNNDSVIVDNNNNNIYISKENQSLKPNVKHKSKVNNQFKDDNLETSIIDNYNLNKDLNIIQSNVNQSEYSEGKSSDSNFQSTPFQCDKDIINEQKQQIHDMAKEISRLKSLLKTKESIIINHNVKYPKCNNCFISFVQCPHCKQNLNFT